MQFEGDRADRDDVEGAAIWRKAQPVHQQLALVKRTETGRRLVTEMDGTPIYGLDEGKLFRPASNVKLFTTSTALALL